MGFLLNFYVGIVQEFCQRWQNFKALVEMYYGYVKFCRIGRISKVLGYSGSNYKLGFTVEVMICGYRMSEGLFCTE